MLVLARKPGESIVLTIGGETVVIKSTEKTKLVIDAPESVEVIRAELAERKRQCQPACTV